MEKNAKDASNLRGMWMFQTVFFQRNVQVSEIILSYIFFALGIAIIKIDIIHSNWISQSIENAQIAEKCIGELEARHAGESFN